MVDSCKYDWMNLHATAMKMTSSLQNMKICISIVFSWKHTSCFLPNVEYTFKCWICIVKLYSKHNLKTISPIYCKWEHVSVSLLSDKYRSEGMNLQFLVSAIVVDAQTPMAPNLILVDTDFEDCTMNYNAGEKCPVIPYLWTVNLPHIAQACVIFLHFDTSL